MKDFFIIKSDIVDVVGGNKNLATVIRSAKTAGTALQNTIPILKSEVRLL